MPLLMSMKIIHQVNSISIYKYGDPDFKRYHPGDKYTWTVRVVNNSANAVDNVVVNDKIIGIDVLLANNGDNKRADITDTLPFMDDYSS